MGMAAVSWSAEAVFVRWNGGNRLIGCCLGEKRVRKGGLVGDEMCNSDGGLESRNDGQHEQ